MFKGQREALKIVADYYSEQQLMEARDILMDMSDELAERGLSKEANFCARVFDLLTYAINLDA